MQDVYDNQLALTLSLPANAELKNFCTGRNEFAYNQVRLIAAGKGEFCVYLWGPPGVGKSHLLQGACEHATLSGLSAIYLPFSKNPQFTINDIVGLEQLDLVCLDDIHLISGKADWEEAIFHLYNKLKANEKHLLVSAPMAPMTQNIQLPDLRTRLGWGVIYHLHPLTDDEKLEALIIRAKQKGMTLPDDVGRFIISRSARSMGELLKGLDTLDKASLTMQRKLTIPFVKQILKL